jgi:regulator of ribonuclease activity A
MTGTDAALQIVTADLFDTYADSVLVCETRFTNLGGRRSFHGPCETVKVVDDHSPLLEIVSTKVENRVLVVDAGGSLRVGVFGDSYASIAQRNGWAGVIVHGAVRDTAFLERIDIGVKALGATARKGLTRTESSRNVGLQFGSAVFEPGDWVYSDSDSVLVSKFELKLVDKKRAY